MDCACLHRRQGIRNPQTTVVVGMDADAARQPAHRSPSDRCNLRWQAPAVGVAQDHHVGPGFFRSQPSIHGVVRIQLEAIKAVLGIVDDCFAMVLQVADRIANHRQILFRRAPKHLPHMKHRGLAKDCHHGGSRLQKQSDLFIILHRHPLPPGRTERGQPRIPEPLLPRLLEELDVLRIGPRPPTLDVVHPEGVQPLRNSKLVGH